MIICNNCGESVEDGMDFCAECGTGVSIVSNYTAHPKPALHPVLPTQPLSVGPTGAAPAPATEQVNTEPVPSPVKEPEKAITSKAANQRSMMILIASLVLVAFAAIAVAVYFVVQSSPPARAAASLKAAITAGRVVTTSNDDAYSYYLQLKMLDPDHRALREVAPQVLPQLRGMGDEVFHKKATVNTEKLTEQDWEKTARIYDWARQLDPNDKKLEARRQFAEGEVAKSQKRIDEAERSFSAAAQTDSSWALPQNSLGLLRSESRRWSDAIPYYQRATELQPDWEVSYNNIGTAYFYLKDYDTAEAWYNAALTRNSNWARPHYWLGSIYQQRGWKAEAVSQYRTALSLDTNGNSLTFEERSHIEKRIAQLQR